MPVEKNIFAACDDNFVEHFCVLASSIYVHNEDANLYLMGVSLNDQSRKVVADTANQFGRKIEIIDIDPQLLNNFPATERWTVAAWSRLYADSLLPRGLGKVLYLDCDILVVADLSDLFELDMEGKSTAARGGSDQEEFVVERRHALNLGQNDPYFNSGVLLMDLPVWREKKLGQKCIEFGQKNAAILTHYDQCSINGALVGDFYALDDCYNAIPFWHDFQSKNPQIIHFASGRKPWSNSPVWGSELYRFYRSLTPLSDLEPISRARLVLSEYKNWRRYKMKLFRDFIGVGKTHWRSDVKRYSFTNVSYLRNLLGTVRTKVENGRYAKLVRSDYVDTL